MSLVLELPEELEQQLRGSAEKMQISPEAFAVSLLEKALASDGGSELSGSELSGSELSGSERCRV